MRWLPKRIVARVHRKNFAAAPKKKLASENAKSNVAKSLTWKRSVVKTKSNSVVAKKMRGQRRRRKPPKPPPKPNFKRLPEKMLDARLNKIVLTSSKRKKTPLGKPSLPKERSSKQILKRDNALKLNFELERIDDARSTFAT